MRKTETHTSSVVDDTDLQILSLLQGNARISIKHIAEKTFLSPTAISARIEKLEKEGEVFVIRPSVPLTISRICKSAEEIEKTYQIGVMDARIFTDAPMKLDQDWFHKN